MLMSKGSLQVIMAIPAVRFRIIWCAATRIRDSSESSAKSFLTICSHVVMAILMDRSTTGWTSSCTARSIACRTHCFSWGWAWNSGIWRRVRNVTLEEYTRISSTLDCHIFQTIFNYTVTDHVQRGTLVFHLQLLQHLFDSFETATLATLSSKAAAEH